MGVIQGVGSRIARGGVRPKKIMQDGAVDMQHGTRVEGFRTCAPKATSPSKGFSLEDPHTKLLYFLYNTVLILYFFSPLQVNTILYNTVLILYFFLLCRLKANHMKEL
jgi:hypothetical protein